MVWESAGVRDATLAAKKPACLQANRAPVPNANDEDCLYLDIYAPRANATGGAAGHPVVVWIHGGSYETGAPPNASAMVDYDGGVVYVGINLSLIHI